jgi:hypothetical protein
MSTFLLLHADKLIVLLKGKYVQYVQYTCREYFNRNFTFKFNACLGILWVVDSARVLNYFLWQGPLNPSILDISVIYPKTKLSRK